MTEKKDNGGGGGERPMRRKPGPRAPRAPRAETRSAPPPSRGGKPTRAFEEAPKRAAKKPREERLAPTPRTTAYEGERIAKVMARAGVCSRRDAEQWIAEGRVAVNGRILTGPAVNVREDDRIDIDGAPMQARERTRLFLFHKPAGYVTTAHDPEGRPTVFSYLATHHADLPRLVSVGRLDINTEGLLLLTNDGGLARTLELPATGWTRRYRVRAHGAVDQAQLDALSEGLAIEGVVYAPIEARLERVQGANAWIAMALTEGKNREVKRVLAHLGLDVARLLRVSYGPFQLGDIAEGAVEEVRLKTLREQLGKTLADFAGVDFGAPLRAATPEEEQEKRKRIETRTRKHVSVLRKERADTRESGPRARVTRSATADRKGRAVAVERVSLTRPRQDEAVSRNARRFDALREDGARRPRRNAGTEETARREDRAPRQGVRSEAARPRHADAGETRAARTPSGAGSRDHGTRREGVGQARAPRREFGAAPGGRGFGGAPRSDDERAGAGRGFRTDNRGARDGAPERAPRGERDGFAKPRSPRPNARTGESPRGEGKGAGAGRGFGEARGKGGGKGAGKGGGAASGKGRASAGGKGRGHAGGARSGEASGARDNRSGGAPRSSARPSGGSVRGGSGRGGPERGGSGGGGPGAGPRKGPRGPRKPREP